MRPSSSVLPRIPACTPKLILAPGENEVFFAEPYAGEGPAGGGR
jgi:hypothetical protein